MRNILSFQPGSKFSGEEILQWAKFQVDNQTSHMRQGSSILRRFGNLRPEREYRIMTSYEGTACGSLIHKPLILKS